MNPIKPPRRVLLSFLGTTNYEECVYYFNNDRNQSYGVDRFVQNSIFKHLCKDWSAEDKYFVFLTDQAEPANWNDDIYKDKLGLQQTLAVNRFKVVPTAISAVPDGFNESQIWQVFQRVFDELKEGDQVWLDITHGFRSLPLLAAVLTNYARFLKNIVIQKIYYGVFESLGPVHQVKKDFPNPADRWVPVLDLTAFSQLQDWTSAANEFVTLGNSAKLSVLTKDVPSLQGLNTHLTKLTRGFGTSRGGDLISGKLFANFRKELAGAGKKTSLPALKPLLEVAAKKIDSFVTQPKGYQDRAKNTFSAIRWCIDHQLTQQGFTLLQEGVITLVVLQMGGQYSDPNLRQWVKVGFNVANLPEKSWLHEAKNDPEKAKKLLKDFPIFKAQTKNFSDLTGLRNDLNHAGYLKSAGNAKNFANRLHTLTEIFEQELDPKPEIGDGVPKNE